MEKDGRILHNNWIEYTADKVVFQPSKMTPDELQDMYYYAWDTFYADSGYELKMGQLFQNVIMREIADNTYKRYDTQVPRRSISTKKWAEYFYFPLIPNHQSEVYSLGMAVVAADLERNGHKVRMYDLL